MEGIQNFRYGWVGLGIVAAVITAAVMGAASGTRHTAGYALRLSAIDSTVAALGSVHNSLLEIDGLSEQAVYVEDWQETLQTVTDGLEKLGSGLEDGAARWAVESYRVAAVGYLDGLRMGVQPNFEPVDERFLEANRSLVDERAGIIAVIDDQGMRAVTVNSVGGVLAGLLIPLLALAGYRVAASRQVAGARRRIEEEAKNRLRQDREELLNGLSHELRTPLTGITGFADLLRTAEIPPEEMTEMIGIISAEAADLSRKVDDIMVASRAHYGELSFLRVRIDVSEAITDALMAVDLIPNHIDIPPDTAIVGDPQRLHQVFRNLMINARQHGGSQLVVSAGAVGDTVSVVVADNGEGLETGPEAVFGGFTTGGNAIVSGSIGLGLYVSRSLAEGMGGSLTYRRVDGWTRFVLDLPKAPPREVRWSELRGVRHA